MCKFCCSGQICHKDLASKHQLRNWHNLPRHSERPVVTILHSTDFYGLYPHYLHREKNRSVLDVVISNLACTQIYIAPKIM